MVRINLDGADVRDVRRAGCAMCLQYTIWQLDRWWWLEAKQTACVQTLAPIIAIDPPEYGIADC